MGRPKINTEEDKKRKAKERLKKWRKENPKKLAVQTKRRRQDYGDKERRRSREWYRAHPEAARARVWPNNLKRFGMTTHDYTEMLAAQDGRCAICRQKPLDGVRRFAVDHSSTTYEIRGILCMRCNLGLGWFRDDPELLKAAIAYLTSPMKTSFKLSDPANYTRVIGRRRNAK